MLGSIVYSPLRFMTEACRGWNDQKLNVLCQKEARLVSWISGQRADCFSLLIWRYLGTQVYSFHVVPISTGESHNFPHKHIAITGLSSMFRHSHFDVEKFIYTTARISARRADLVATRRTRPQCGAHGQRGSEQEPATWMQPLRWAASGDFDSTVA